ncbi:MAG: hypothetical protein ACJ796_12460 [Gemmatimonadaceae bacterium]
MERRLLGRTAIVVVASTIALLLLIFPPWRARAIRTTTRYAAVPGVAPAVAIDSIAWPLSFAPIYSPPRAPLSGDRMRELAVRIANGDTSARRVLREATAEKERLVHVPEVLQTSGELWRDSVLTAAGIPASSSYDLTFAIDQRWLAARLAAVALLALLIDSRATRRRSSDRG